jgi:hypothetical protein
LQCEHPGQNHVATRNRLLSRARRSGLGIEAQRARVEQFAAAEGFDLIA